MKKFTAVILACLLATSAVLSGCGNNKDKGDDKKDKKQQAEKRVGTDEEVNANTEFNAEFEERLSKIIDKSEIDNEILLNVSGIPVSAAFVRYAVIACNANYAQSTEENIEEIKADEIDRFFRLNAFVVNKADEMGITIDDDEFETNFSDVNDQFKDSFGDEYSSIIEQYTYQTPYAYFLSMYYNYLYSKIYDEYSNDEAFAAKVREKTLKDMTEGENEYVRAKHILISFPEEGEGEDGEVTDAQKAAVLEKANEVYTLAKNDGDFDALVKEYGEDPGMETYPGGYYFTTGAMVEEFETTAFNLEEGEISEPVETPYGYHIIQRLPLDDDAIIATDEYMNNGYEIFSDELDALAEDYSIIYSEKYEDRRDDFLAEYEEIFNPTEDEAEDEHDHDNDEGNENADGTSDEDDENTSSEDEDDADNAEDAE